MDVHACRWKLDGSHRFSAMISWDITPTLVIYPLVTGTALLQP